MSWPGSGGTRAVLATFPYGWMGRTWAGWMVLTWGHRTRTFVFVNSPPVLPQVEDSSSPREREEWGRFHDDSGVELEESEFGRIWNRHWGLCHIAESPWLPRPKAVTECDCRVCRWLRKLDHPPGKD